MTMEQRLNYLRYKAKIFNLNTIDNDDIIPLMLNHPDYPDADYVIFLTGLEFNTEYDEVAISNYVDNLIEQLQSLINYKPSQDELIYYKEYVMINWRLSASAFYSLRYDWAMLQLLNRTFPVYTAAWFLWNKLFYTFIRGKEDFHANTAEELEIITQSLELQKQYLDDYRVYFSIIQGHIDCITTEAEREFSIH